MRLSAEASKAICSYSLRNSANGLTIRVFVAKGPRGELSKQSRPAIWRFRPIVTLAAVPICPAMVPNIAFSGADIVHIHLPNPGAVLAILLSGYRGRLVATWHSDVVRQRKLARHFSDRF